MVFSHVAVTDLQDFGQKSRLVYRTPGSGFKGKDRVAGGGEKWYPVISIYREVMIKGMNVIQRMCI